jgi:hypothetical protein
VIVTTLALIAAGGLWIAARPLWAPPSPLPLTSDGAERPTTLRDAAGRLLFYDFRTVEPGVVYRAGGFPQNGETFAGDRGAKTLAALTGDTAFQFLRSLNVRRVFALQHTPELFYAEAGYFEYWGEQTGYHITVTWVPVTEGHEYARTDRGALHAAAELIAFMQKPAEGAVLIHDDGRGSDATGVAVAGYELWRNRDRIETDYRLWNEVTNRYLMSNRYQSMEMAAAPFTRGQIRCTLPRSEYVCRDWLNKIRAELEFIARL